MTVLGSDASYRSGGPQVPLQEDSAKTAAENFPARALLITKDSINDAAAKDMMLNTDEMKRSGHYQPQPPKPNLDMPLFKMRMGDVSQKPSDEALTSNRQTLINVMAEDAQTRLSEEEQRPLDQRSFLYKGLGDLLTIAARILEGAKNAGQPLTEESVSLQRYQNFALLPYIGLLGATRNGEDVTSSLQENLQELGHNYPDFDALMQESGNFIQLMQSFSEVSEKALSGQATSADAEKMKELAAQLEQQIGNLEGRDIGGASGVFLPHLQAAHLVAQSFSDPTHAAPSTLMGQNIAQIGLQGESESSAAIGHTLSAGLDKGLFENLGGSPYVVKTLVTALLLGVAVTAALVSAKGLGSAPQNEDKEAEASKSFDTQITMHFVLKTGLFESMINGIANAAQVPDKDRAQFHAAVLLGVIATAVLVSGKNNEDKQAALASSLENFIQPSLEQLSQNQVSEEIDEDNAAKNIALQQSMQALTNGHFQEMVAICKSMLGESNGGSEALEKDLSTFLSTVSTFGESVQNGINAQNSKLPSVALAA